MLLCSRSSTLALRYRLVRAGAPLALCAMLITTTGCFGTFPVTRTIYRENQEVSHVEFHQTLAFWAMLLTLVYPGALITDAIVMNTVEFWNPKPTSWEASGGYLVPPGDRYESAEIPAASSASAPLPALAPVPLTAPAAWPAELPAPAPPQSTVRWMDSEPEPLAAAPGTEAPEPAPALAPLVSPTVPLPLPELAPAPGQSAAATLPADRVHAPGA